MEIDFISHDSPEGHVAWRVLCRGIANARWLQAGDAARPAAERIVWMHAGTSAEFSELAPIFLPHLARHLAAAGRLLLTLQACRAVARLQLEDEHPGILHEELITEPSGEHSMRGLLSFMGHPLFAPFHGGVYLWRPQPGETASLCGYRREQRGFRGDAVAVDRFHLGQDPDRILCWEYARPRVLCVGAYLPFAGADALYREARQRFLHRCLEYLSEALPKERPLWPVQNTGVQIAKLHADLPHAPLPRSERTANTPLSLPAAPGRPFDLAGERMLVMGEIGAGLDEVWVHPFRLLHDFRMRIAGSEKALPVTAAAVTPERASWRIDTGDAVVAIDCHVSPEQPVGALRISGLHPEQGLELDFFCDLRLMWNYAPGTPGPLSVSVYGNGLTVQAQHVPACGWFIVQGGRGRCDAHDAGAARESCARIRWRLKAESAQVPVVFRFGGAYLEECADLPMLQSLSAAEFAAKAQQRIQALAQETPALNCPDEEVARAFTWAKLRLDNFFGRTPGLGQSYLAGFGTTRPGWFQARPGYAWYFGRDAVFTAFAALFLGQFERARSVLQFLAGLQRFDGKILHECTTSGVVHYDAADATPLFLLLLARYFHHSGDRAFVREHWAAAAKAMRFLFCTDRDGDGFIENTGVGHGWIEGGRLYGAHVEFYLAGLWVATLKEMAHLARIAGNAESARAWAGLAAALRKRLNREFWLPQQKYYAPGRRRDGTRMPFRTIMPSVPIWLRLCNQGKARRVAERMLARDMTADWGCRMVSRQEPYYNPDGYHEGSVWPLFTGWVCLAAFETGQSAAAYQLLQQHMQAFKHFAPGGMPEVLHGERYEAIGICPHQAWSDAMNLLPVFEGLWGIAVRGGRELHCTPRLPAHWDAASLTRLRIGASRVDIRMQRQEATVSWIFEVQGAPVRLYFHPQTPLVAEVSAIQLRGAIQATQGGFPVKRTLPPGRLELTVTYRSFFDVIPPLFALQPGQASYLPRLVAARTGRDGNVVLALQAPAGARLELAVVCSGKKWLPRPEVPKLRANGKSLTYLIVFKGKPQTTVRREITFVLAKS